MGYMLTLCGGRSPNAPDHNDQVRFLTVHARGHSRLFAPIHAYGGHKHIVKVRWLVVTGLVAEPQMLNLAQWDRWRSRKR